MMIPSKLTQNITTNNVKYQNLDVREGKLSSKKAYHHAKSFAAANCSSAVSWFVILTCFGISLFLLFLNSSVLSVSSSITIESVKNEEINTPAYAAGKIDSDSLDNPYREKPDAGSSDDPFVEKSDTGSLANQQIVKSDAGSSGNPYAKKSNDCVGKYIYVLDVPREFNDDLVENCSTLSPWTNMCKLLNNSGMGPRMNKSADDVVFTGSGWYGTDQFSLEVLFRNRMKQYRCLTNDYTKASAVYVPYYPGLDVGRYLWNSTNSKRDETALKFLEYIKQRPEWKKLGGRDHFLVVGRITWDFRRPSTNGSDETDWGNRLFHLPEIKNMTNLVIESSPSSKHEIGIPYPTYFHPSSGKEVQSWQEEMRQKKRPYLFSFAGAPRPKLKESIRNDIIKQCVDSKHCKFVHCDPDVIDCSKPQTVMRLFQSSVFCLQPPGDSYTRKSIFDTIQAGCIPVLLHPDSAYVQYLWHLPKNYTSYSVFISMDDVKAGNVSIEERLLAIPKLEVAAMREQVIKLIPRVVYANPTVKLDGLEDAFDVAVKGVIDRVNMIKKDMKRGKNSTYDNVPDDLAWKYNFFGNLENDEWDNFFGDNFGIK